MLVYPLGHTEFGIEINNKQGESIKILVDAWLSDYTFGDLMERTPRIKLDSEKIKMLDVMFLSHAHCDHFDPYTLVPIFQIANPLMIIPETLAYLEPVVREYIPKIKIHLIQFEE